MNVDGKVVFCQIRWRTRNLCNGVFLEVGRKQNTGMMLCEEDVLQPHMDGDVGMWSELEMRSGRPRKKRDAAARMLWWRSWSGSTEVSMNKLCIAVRLSNC